MKKIFIVMVAFFGLLFSGCTESKAAADIYTTIYPIEFIVREIVQNRYTVESVYPRGKDVHDYEASPKDLMRMSDAKLIFYIGLGLEVAVEGSLDSTLKDVPSVSVAKGLDLVELNSGSDVHTDHEEENVFYDPHVWLDPDKMSTIADTVLESILETLKPEDEVFFQENTEHLKQQLHELDQDFYTVVNNPQISNKTILVDHDAYVYWEQRYGIKRIRLRNDNDSPDVIPSEMQKKITLARELGIRYICTTKNEVESSMISQYMVQLDITEENKVQLHHLETITADEEKSGMDYFSIMRDNLRTLEKAFPKK